MTTIRLANARVIFPRKGPPAVRGTLVLRGGKIEAFHEDPNGREGDGDTIDLDGRWVLPAFCDSHQHLYYASQRRAVVDLESATSREGLLRALGLSRDVTGSDGKGGGWRVGSGWGESLLADLGRDPGPALAALNFDGPLFLWSRDHHRALVNEAAAVRLGVPPGLIVEKDAERAWSGVPPLPARLRDEIAALHELGIAAVSCFDRGDSWRAMAALAAEGALRLRVRHASYWPEVLAGEAPDESEAPGEKQGSDFRSGWIKLFADGTLGSRTAWLFEDYDDDPGNCGVGRLDPDELRRGWGRLTGGEPIAVHAIGDRAVDEAMRLIARIQDERGPHIADRIEHAQLVADATVPMLAARAITLSVQPCHLLADRRIAPERWGRRCRDAFAFRRLTDAGIQLVFGSDHPIESPDPWRNIGAACERREPEEDAVEAWIPEQCLGFAEALAASTADAAAANLLPRGWGTLEPGTPADLQVLEAEDPALVRCARDARVVGFFIDGLEILRRF